MFDIIVDGDVDFLLSKEERKARRNPKQEVDHHDDLHWSPSQLPPALSCAIHGSAVAGSLKNARTDKHYLWADPPASLGRPTRLDAAYARVK